MLNVTRTVCAIALFFALSCGLASAQVNLTAAQMEGFLKAYKETEAISKRPTAQSHSALLATVKKHGFKDYVEFGQVAEAIASVLAGIDPETKTYNDPGSVIRAEIERVRADTGTSADEKKQIVDGMSEALKALPPLPPKANIDLVTRNYDRLVAVMQ